MLANQFTSSSVKFLISSEMEKILPGDRAAARKDRLACPCDRNFRFLDRVDRATQAEPALQQGITMASSANKAVESLRKEQREQREDEKKVGGSAEKQLDKALKDTFPASDPVAPQVPTKPGAPKHRS